MAVAFHFLHVQFAYQKLNASKFALLPKQHFIYLFIYEEVYFAGVCQYNYRCM